MILQLTTKGTEMYKFNVGGNGPKKPPYQPEPTSRKKPSKKK